MRWTVHGRTPIYSSSWVTLDLLRVELPDGQRYDHHAIGGPDAAGAVVTDPRRGTLMMWRHRILSDEWGWEIPGGMVDPGESPAEAAARECVEESGQRPGPLTLVHRFAPIAGQSSQQFWIYAADSATEIGPADSHEAERIEWLDRDRLIEIIRDNSVLDAMSVIAVLHHLAFGPGGPGSSGGGVE